MRARFLGTGLALLMAFGSGLCQASEGHGHGSAGGHLTKCPVMGDDPIDLSISLATAAGPVYFCCAGCDKKLVNNPEKYLPKLAAQGIGVSAKDLVGAKKSEGSGHRN